MKEIKTEQQKRRATITKSISFYEREVDIARARIKRIPEDRDLMLVYLKRCIQRLLNLTKLRSQRDKRHGGDVK